MGGADSADQHRVTVIPEMPTGPPPPSGIVDDRLLDKVTPYLGPDPVSSRQLGMAFRVLSFCGAALWVVRALLLYAQASSEPVVEMTGFGTGTVKGANAELLAVLNMVGVGMVVALIVVDLLWRKERRPKDVLQTYGEAYVELPMIWVFPMRYRLVLGAGVGLALVARMKGTITDATVVTDVGVLQEAYRWSAVSAIGWAVVWGAGAALPWLADRSHDRRLAWSTWYRERPGTVGFVAPVRDNDIGEPAGFGWILRTAGLVLAAFLGLIFFIAGMELSGEGARAGAFLWLFMAALTEGLVIRAFVQRRTPRNIRNGF
jgi:hypothetical protein